MWKKMVDIFNFLIGLFRSLPEEQQEKIKKVAAEQFEEIFRRFFQHASKG